jgi:hypothetical protein
LAKLAILKQQNGVNAEFQVDLSDSRFAAVLDGGQDGRFYELYIRACHNFFFIPGKVWY